MAERRSRQLSAALIIGAVFVLLRAPSLIEPPAFSDEGTYTDIGWALDHGAVLYRDVWDNKPPGVYWLAAAISALHTSVPAVHVVVALMVAATAVSIWFLCRRLASEHVAWAATFAFVVLASLPTLGGDLLNAEGAGAMLVVIALLLVAKPSGVRVVAGLAAGLLLGAALLFKATFVADLVAVAAIPAWVALASGRRPGRQEGRAATTLLAGAALIVGVAAFALAIGGSFPGLLGVLTHQDVTYLQSVSSGALGSGSPGAQGSGLLTLLTVLRLAVVLAAGGAVTWRLARRRQMLGTVAVWWLTWDLAAAMVSARGLNHYVQQAEPAVCVCVALAAETLLRRFATGPVAVSLATTVAAWAVCVAAVIAPTAEVAIAVPQPVFSLVSAIVSPQAVTHYLGRGWERIAGMITPATYDSGFGKETGLTRTSLTVIDGHSRPGDRVFVWGRLPWVYALSARLPAGRYVTLGIAYSLEPGSQALLEGDLREHPPKVLVQMDPLPPAVSEMLRTLRYTELSTPVISSPNERVVSWIAPWQ